MAFHYGTSPSSGSYREILVRLTAFATSKYLSAAVVNAGGSNYAIGDLVSVPHASAYGAAVVEVLTLSGSAIATVKVRAQGAYARRVGAVVINGAGSGYVAGDIVEVSTGTATEKAKVKVVTIGGGGAAATIAVFETGGAYSVDPTTTACVTDSSIGTGTGTGLTVDITMQAIVGASGIATTAVTGIGSGATLNLTLVQSAWTVKRSWNNYSVNSVTDEKEMILQGTAGGGATDPIVGIRTYTQTSGINTNHGWVLVGMDSFNSGLAFTAQVGVGPSTTVSATGAIVLLMFDNAQNYWFNVTGRRLISVIKAVGASTTTYQTGYLGLLNPFGTSSEAPYPMYVSGSTRSANRAPDSAGFFVSGPTEVFADSTSTAPAAFRKASDGTYQAVQNGSNGSRQFNHCVTPISYPQEATSANADDVSKDAFMNIGGTVALATGGVATTLLMPTLTGNETLLYPATVVSAPGGAGANDSETTVRGELDAIFWMSATKSDATAMVAEDTITVGSQRYRVFQNAHRTERYSYFALTEA